MRSTLLTLATFAALAACDKSASEAKREADEATNAAQKSAVEATRRVEETTKEAEKKVGDRQDKALDAKTAAEQAAKRERIDLREKA